jgi:hypothetical protein
MQITMRMRMSTHENCETQDRCCRSALIRYIACVTSGAAVEMLQCCSQQCCVSLLQKGSRDIRTTHFSAPTVGVAFRIYHTAGLQ